MHLRVIEDGLWDRALVEAIAKDRDEGFKPDFELASERERVRERKETFANSTR